MPEKIRVMVVGAGGKTGGLAAGLVSIQPDMELLSLSLSGHKTQPGTKKTFGGVDVELIPYDKRQEGADRLAQYEPFVVLDFAKDMEGVDNRSVLDNGLLYIQRRWNAVMGGTGGDISKLEEAIAGTGSAIVHGTNMQGRIVGVQTIFKELSERFVFEMAKEDDLYIDFLDGHQTAKGDEPSGTGDTIRKYVNRTRVPFEKGQMQIVRNKIPGEFDAMGVPKYKQGAFGWHYYVFSAARIQVPLVELAEVAKIFVRQHPLFEKDSKFYVVDGRVVRGNSVAEKGNPPELNGMMWNREFLKSKLRNERARIQADNVDAIYALSPEGDVCVGVECLQGSYLGIIHDVVGRDPYALPALDYIRHVAQHGKEMTGKVTSVADVCKLKGFFN